MFIGTYTAHTHTSLFEIMNWPVWVAQKYVTIYYIYVYTRYSWSKRVQ